MPPSPPTARTLAVAVLGCRVRVDCAERLCPSVLSARVEAAAALYRLRGAEQTIIVASGGASWEGRVEADAMAAELARQGVPEGSIVRERASRSTRENASATAALLRERGIEAVTVVTSDWHLPRALRLFRRAGLVAAGWPAAGEREGPRAIRLWRAGRERVLSSWFGELVR